MDDFIKISDINWGTDKSESPIEDLIIWTLNRFGIEHELQKKIGPYRADIFVQIHGSKIVVECDGVEFHQDKERDAKRDEYMKSLGYDVLRFTGSEIHKNPVRCVFRIISYSSRFFYEEPDRYHRIRKFADRMDNRYRTYYPDEEEYEEEFSE